MKAKNTSHKNIKIYKTMWSNKSSITIISSRKT